MALVTCPDCGKRVSDKAEACPNCGSPISQVSDQLLFKEKESKRVAEAHKHHAHELKTQNKLDRPQAFIFILTIQSILSAIGILIPFFLLLEKSARDSDSTVILGVIAVALNGITLLFLYKLYRWKKSGFWGILIFSIVGFVFSLSVGYSYIMSSLSFLWISVLYLTMRKKTHGQSVWSMLD